MDEAVQGILSRWKSIISKKAAGKNRTWRSSAYIKIINNMKYFVVVQNDITGPRLRQAPCCGPKTEKQREKKKVHRRKKL
jgi:hypothetical protein